MSPQANKLLAMLRRDGHVTRLTAMHAGISNVTARIADLRILHGRHVAANIRTDITGRKYTRWYLTDE